MRNQSVFLGFVFRLPLKHSINVEAVRVEIYAERPNDKPLHESHHVHHVQLEHLHANRDEEHGDTRTLQNSLAQVQSPFHTTTRKWRLLQPSFGTG